MINNIQPEVVNKKRFDNAMYNFCKKLTFNSHKYYIEHQMDYRPVYKSAGGRKFIRVKSFETARSRRNGSLIDGTDNFKSKSLICKIAFNKNIPLVYGGLSQWEGQVCIFDPKSDSICFECIFPNDPGEEFDDSCFNFGIIGPTVGVIGSLMAAEVIKLLTSCGVPILNKILTFDCLNGEFQKFEVEKVKSCNICSKINKI